MNQFNIIGYDPGGNGSHGVCILTITQGEPVNISVKTFEDAETVFKFASTYKKITSVGIDTLTCWNTGRSGWRPADLFLRNRYKEVIHSVTSPNSLSGSMGINGMAVLLSIQDGFPNILISETHPKVLYFALSGFKYNYKEQAKEMDAFLSELLNIKITTSNDHEWDAVLSAYASFMGLTKKWTCDLHTYSNESTGEAIQPVGLTNYWWPNESIDDLG